ncbi:helix-turn-helix domain-containing protein [Rhodobacterales bacterium HKCCE2091]|nr:helix-turn-helix domain-containing protein [Rhodobacterales bacterium HKCCE2091]
MRTLQSFAIDQTHGILAQPSNRIHASSSELGWTSLFASRQDESPFEASFGAVEDFLLVRHQDGPVEIHGASGGSRFSRVVPPGGIHIIPGGADFQIRLGERLKTLHVYIRREVLLEVAAQMVSGDPDKVAVTPGIVENDRALGALLDAVSEALSNDDDGTPLYVDYLSQAIAAQLIRSYSGAEFQSQQSVLPRRGSLNSIVSNAIEYMRENLDQPIRLSDIADAINRSSSHLAREFRAGTGLPPHQFLIKLRVEVARDLLEKTHLPIAEIAFECGFSHQEHMTRQFRRHCGTTPAAYRRMKSN